MTDEDPFIQLVNLLSHVAGDLIDELDLPGGPSQNHPTYLATLIGLEGEEVQEMVVPAGPNGYPPMRVTMAHARPVTFRALDEAPDPRAPTFDTVEFESYARCTSGCCVWYCRTTPLWRG